MSTFGGPRDLGVGPDEGLALIGPHNFPEFSDLFLRERPPGTTGLARRLDPEKLYLACRWRYGDTPKSFLVNTFAQVTNPKNGKTAQAKPVDWGPSRATGRVADLSPGLADKLGLATDDIVEVLIDTDLASERGLLGMPADRPFSNEEMKRHFGDFRWKEDPRRRGAIIIEPAWRRDNLRKVFVPALKGKPTYNNGTFRGNVTFHKDTADALTAAFEEVLKEGLDDLILHWGGSWVARHKNWNPNRDLSSHSWGTAFDINVPWNGYGHTPPALGEHGSVRDLVPILEAHGFFWGGNFSTPDGMHFEYARVPD
jgi:hypothetical protein